MKDCCLQSQEKMRVKLIISRNPQNERIEKKRNQYSDFRPVSANIIIIMSVYEWWVMKKKAGEDRGEHLREAHVSWYMDERGMFNRANSLNSLFFFSGIPSRYCGQFQWSLAISRWINLIEKQKLFEFSLYTYFLATLLAFGFICVLGVVCVILLDVSVITFRPSCSSVSIWHKGYVWTILTIIQMLLSKYYQGYQTLPHYKTIWTYIIGLANHHWFCTSYQCAERVESYN